MATPHPGDNAAAQHLKGIDKLNNNYKTFLEKIKILKDSPNVNQRDVTDLENAVDNYKVLIEKVERAAADHRFILGALNAHMAKAKAKKADKKVEGSVKELSYQHELEQKRLEKREIAARQDVAGRVSDADQTFRSSVSAWRDRVSNDSTNQSVNNSDFGWTWASIDTIDP